MNTLLAQLNGSDSAIIRTVVWIVILGIIFALLVYFKLPGPFLKIAQVVLVVAACYVLIKFLLTLT